MRLSIMCLLVLASVPGWGQSATAAPKSLAKCRQQLALSTTETEQFTNLWHESLADSGKLEANNKALQEENATLQRQLEELRGAALEVANFARELDGSYRNLLTDHNALIDKYNATLRQAQTDLSLANSRLARQYQISNALAIYNALPKYTPPQTVNTRVTNCAALPALCAGQ